MGGPKRGLGATCGDLDCMSELFHDQAKRSTVQTPLRGIKQNPNEARRLARPPSSSPFDSAEPRPKPLR